MANRHPPLFLKGLKSALRLFLVFLLLGLAGCSSWFFYPDQHTYATPDELGLKWQDLKLNAEDGTQLDAWLLPARGQSKGVVYYLHGNAQNMSADLANVAWLPAAHYSVFMIDYRGFGKSEGSPDMAGALDDARAGLKWVFQHRNGQPVFLLGQSLGAALALDLAGRWRQLGERPAAVVADGAFSGWRHIAREKLAGFWLTWPFQIPLSWTIPDSADPIDRVADISPVPLLLIASHQDRIVPFSNGKRLFRAAQQPKQFLATDTAHTETFLVPGYRQDMLNFLAKYGGGR